MARRLRRTMDARFPTWQHWRREIPGMAVYVDGKLQKFLGTSAATPLWAGLIARINETLQAIDPFVVGYITPLLYTTRLGKAPNMRDIVKGRSADYSAQPGWDPCTGWGTPHGVELLKSLIGLRTSPPDRDR